jgi:hypothetical protein
MDRCRREQTEIERSSEPKTVNEIRLYLNNEKFRSVPSNLVGMGEARRVNCRSVGMVFYVAGARVLPIPAVQE